MAGGLALMDVGSKEAARRHGARFVSYVQQAAIDGVLLALGGERVRGRGDEHG